MLADAVRLQAAVAGVLERDYKISLTTVQIPVWPVVDINPFTTGDHPPDGGGVPCVPRGTQT